MAISTLIQTSPSQSPYRDYVHLKQLNRQIKLEAPLKAAVLFAVAAFLYVDIYYFSMINRLVELPSFAEYVKAVLAAVFVVLGVGHCASFAYAHLSPDREIEERHAKLLNISRDDLGFKIKPDSPPQNRKQSPRIETLPPGSFCLPSAQNSFNDSFNNSITSTSWQYQSSSTYRPSLSHETLLGLTRYPNSRALDWHIEDEQSAEAYLQERSREHSFLGSIHEDLDTSLSPKKASVMDTSVEVIERLFKAHPYKLASPSHVENEQSSESGSAMICRRWHIDENELFRWNEQLRFWFHKEIFVPLRDQIDEINSKIANFGFGKDYAVGVASTVQLRHLNNLKGNLLPGLENVIPYLEITMNQQYMVSRIRDFCKGGALSEMNWNRGSATWQDQLPPDAEIIMHAFCTYIDSRLAADPEFPDGRQFSKLHFRNSVGQANIDTRGSPMVVIHHTKKCPPHYLLQLMEDVVDVGSGSNNALHTIILFLYYHKIKNDSRICRMAMGPCGMDLERIIS